jgi:hypothetical protein
MSLERRDILFGVLATIVVGVAAVGIAIGIAGLQPPRGLAVPPASIRYVCIPGHASFTIEDIEAAAPAGARADPARSVLVALLDEQAGIEESELPMDGWLRVVDTPEEVVLLAETPDAFAPYAVVHVVPGNVGGPRRAGWAADSYGPCTPRPHVSDDVSVAEWWADPDADPIGPRSERIRALVHEQACANGQSAEGRILPPTIVYGTDEVTVTVIVQSIVGGAECPGNPRTPYTIELDEPLGDRTLLDGGQLPPGDPLEDPQN